VYGGYTNFRKVKAEIIGVDFRNIIYQPIEVHFLEGMEREDSELCYDAPFGWMGIDDYPGHSIKVKTKYDFDFVSVNQIEILTKL